MKILVGNVLRYLIIDGRVKGKYFLIVWIGFGLEPDSSTARGNWHETLVA
jgi:hypothetical protein